MSSIFLWPSSGKDNCSVSSFDAVTINIGFLNGGVRQDTNLDFYTRHENISKTPVL